MLRPQAVMLSAVQLADLCSRALTLTASRRASAAVRARSGCTSSSSPGCMGRRLIKKAAGCPAVSSALTSAAFAALPHVLKCRVKSPWWEALMASACSAL